MPPSPTPRPRVAVLGGPRDRPPDGLGELAPHVEIARAHDAAELASALAGAEVLLVLDFRSRAVREAWPDAGHVAWIHAGSAGVDRLLFPELVASDVVLTNARGVFDETIAETVLGWILHFAKDVGHTIELQRARRWHSRETERVAGTRALVVGAGSIGRAIARKLSAVGLTVTGTASRTRDDPDFEEIGGPEDLHRLLGDADWVVVAAPLTRDTKGLFGAPEFAAMKPTARFFNVGRGPIVKTGALVDALRRGTIGGAALDVFESEPLPPDDPLWGVEHLLISPHMSGDFVGWQETIGRQFVENFRRWQAGEPLENVIDKERARALAPEETRSTEGDSG